MNTAKPTPRGKKNALKGKIAVVMAQKMSPYNINGLRFARTSLKEPIIIVLIVPTMVVSATIIEIYIGFGESALYIKTL